MKSVEFTKRQIDIKLGRSKLPVARFTCMVYLQICWLGDIRCQVIQTDRNYVLLTELKFLNDPSLIS